MRELFEKYLTRIDKLGGDSRQLIFEKPARPLKVLEIEKTLTFELPSDFKNVLLTVSSHCEFKWFLPDNFPLPEPLRQIFCGELHWGIIDSLAINNSTFNHILS